MQAQDSSHPKGVSSDNEGGSTLTRARERKADSALALRLGGVPWPEIAEALGYPTARAASNAVELALSRRLDTDPNSQEKMRKLAEFRLERLLQAVWPKALDPNHPDQLAAHKAARETIGDHRKLMGLDAPTEISVHTPTRAELDQWVAVALSTTQPALEEADIFDGVIVEPEALEA